MVKWVEMWRGVMMAAIALASVSQAADDAEYADDEADMVATNISLENIHIFQEKKATENAFKNCSKFNLYYKCSDGGIYIPHRNFRYAGRTDVFLQHGSRKWSPLSIGYWLYWYTAHPKANTRFACEQYQIISCKVNQPQIVTTEQVSEFTCSQPCETHTRLAIALRVKNLGKSDEIQAVFKKGMSFKCNMEDWLGFSRNFTYSCDSISADDEGYMELEVDPSSAWPRHVSSITGIFWTFWTFGISFRK